MESRNTSGVRTALLVAADTYADPRLSRLRAPIGDVNALAEILADPALGGFELRRLVNRPTEEIKREMESFFDDASLGDLLLLYMSGHGVLSPTRRFYFATASTQLKWLRATAIEDSFVNDVMQHSRARSVVLIVDCCHSGAFSKGLVPKSAPTVDVVPRFEGRGRLTLTASTELEYAFEETETDAAPSDLGAASPGSVFTRFLVEGIRTGAADADQDGQISIDELYDYVYANVRRHSPHQTPGKGGGGHGDLIIAASPRGASLPHELRQALESPIASVREATVAELSRMRRAARPAMAGAITSALRDTLTDDSLRVRQAAEVALADLAGSGELPATALPTAGSPVTSADARSGPEQAPRPAAASASPARRKRPPNWLLAILVLVAGALVAVVVVALGNGGSNSSTSSSGPSVTVQPARGTLLGSDLRPTSLDTCFGPNEICTVVQYALPGRPTVAAVDGVITRWGARAHGRIALQVVRLNNTAVTAVTQSNFETANGYGYFRTNLPIKQGDFIALLMCANARVGQSGNDGDIDLRWSNGLFVGQPRAPSDKQLEEKEYAFNATIVSGRQPTGKQPAPRLCS